MDQWWQPLLEHDGLLLRERVLAAGIDPDVILTGLRSSRIRRIQRGVYAPRSIELTPAAIARAAIISSGEPDAVASHLTAARIHDLAMPFVTGPEHVTVCRSERRRRRRELVFHGRPLALGDVVLRDGVPMTTVPRTLVDLAGMPDRLFAVWAVDDAIRRGLADRAEIRHAAGRWVGPGSTQVRRRMDEADGKAESILETAGRLRLLDAHVPLPEAQHLLCDDDGTLIARLDGAYLRERIGIEYDGQGPHSQPSAIFRDRWRQNRVHALGWRILRFTWWDVMRDPTQFVESVRAALRMEVTESVGCS